jgi:adenosylmethionine-8-amino-7-oxononanoate aminotransferase
MAAVEGREVVIDSGEGAWVTDTSGKRYLDGSAGLWYCNVGHGRGELATVAERQMRRLAAYQTFDVMANTPALELAERIGELAPLGPESAAFFTVGGSDAIDSAAKIARRYWITAGEPQRKVIISRDGGYHGMNAYGTSLAGIEANASGWGPLVNEVVQIPHDSLDALDQVLSTQGSEVAAFIGEPVQGAGGVRPPADGYWQGVNDLCRQYDVLLIVDEVVTGFGRVGQWFGCDRYGIEPDMITVAKGITSGYMPLGAVIANKRVKDLLWSEAAGVFRHGYTYSGHPTACAVALENLNIIERENLIERVAELEPVLREQLSPLAEHPAVAEVRTAGLLTGVELSEQARTTHPALVDEITQQARQRGVLIRNLIGKTLQISPPFVINSDEIKMLAEVIDASIRAVVGGGDLAGTPVEAG